MPRQNRRPPAGWNVGFHSEHSPASPLKEEYFRTFARDEHTCIYLPVPPVYTPEEYHGVVIGVAGALLERSNVVITLRSPPLIRAVCTTLDDAWRLKRSMLLRESRRFELGVGTGGAWHSSPLHSTPELNGAVPQLSSTTAKPPCHGELSRQSRRAPRPARNGALPALNSSQVDLKTRGKVWGRKPVPFWKAADTVGGPDVCMEREVVSHHSPVPVPIYSGSTRVPLPAGAQLEFMTDVEGNLQYFTKLIEHSDVLSLRADGTLCLADNGYFVFGGDSVDKGPGDIRVVKHLVSLKERHPERVFLILGNRDINKLRFGSELGAEGCADRASDGRHIYWDPKCKSYDDYVSERGYDADGSAEDVKILKWMLECTMGCQTTFETRRVELGVIAALDSSKKDAVTTAPSDAAVLKSFTDSVDPSGADPWMLKYLQYGQLMLVIGDCLFVHGGVSDDALGVVPGCERFQGLLEWCTKLNRFAADEIAAYIAAPGYTLDNTRAAEALLRYAVPNPPGSELEKSTVIYNDGLISGGSSVVTTPGTSAFLRANGVRRVFSGHRPHGDAPAVVRARDKSLVMMCCDTSYSDVKAKKFANPAENRGEAWASVKVTSASTTVTGVLADGTQHGYVLPVDPSVNGERADALVGSRLSNGSWVKSVLRSGKSEGNLLVALGKGTTVTATIMSPQDLKQLI